MKRNKPIIPLVPQDILYTQQYLIGGFTMEGGASDFQGILKKEMFGMYASIFQFLMNNPGKMCEALPPDLYKIIDEGVGVPLFMEVLSTYGGTFPDYREKSVQKLFEWYVKNVGDAPIDRWDDVKRIHAKIESIRVGKVSLGISTLLHETEDLIEAMRDKNGILGYSTGLPTVDKYTEGIQKGTVMRLNAYSNSGKSKLSYFVCNHLLRQKAKVIYFSLEVGKKIVLLNLLANWYRKDYYTVAKGRELIDFSEYSKLPIEIIDNVYELKDIISIAELERPDVIFIDFLQNVKHTGNGEYERMTNIAIDIQQMAIKNNIAVFDLSQVSNEGAKYKKGGIIPSKGSGALVASADVGLLLQREGEKTSLFIAKNKFGHNGVEIQMSVDFSKGDFVDESELVPIKTF